MEGGGGGDLLTARHLEQVASVLLANQKQLYCKSSDDELMAPEDDCIFDYLDKSNDKAEARLAARRQARVEAREIRMREVERQQKEKEENADRVYDMYTEPVARSPRVAAVTAAAVSSPRLNVSALAVNNSYHSSRRSSEDSLEETGSMRDVRHELKEVEEKFRKAMIQNAQLDNEKASLNYQVELLKDRLEDLEEAHSQLQREHKEKCRQHEQLKRTHARLQEDMQCCKAQLQERDELITNHGLQIVGGEEGDTKRELVSLEGAQMLQAVGQGSLDVRLRRLGEERNDLADQVRRLRMEMEEGRSQTARSTRAASTGGATVNGVADTEEAQRETNKIIADYRFKLQKAEQDVSTLQANVARLESQVVRYKGASESSEKVEDELKVEKRKLQREESQESDDSAVGECDVNNVISDVGNISNVNSDVVNSKGADVAKESGSRCNVSEGNDDSDNENTDGKNIPELSEDCENLDIKENVLDNENVDSDNESSKSKAGNTSKVISAKMSENSESKKSSNGNESDDELKDGVNTSKEIDKIEEYADLNKNTNTAGQSENNGVDKENDHSTENSEIVNLKIGVETDENFILKKTVNCSDNDGMKESGDTDEKDNDKNGVSEKHPADSGASNGTKDDANDGSTQSDDSEEESEESDEETEDSSEKISSST